MFLKGQLHLDGGPCKNDLKKLPQCAWHNIFPPHKFHPYARALKPMITNNEI